MNLEERLLRTISDYSLLKQGDTVLVALSGGPDSVALLHLLNGLRDKYNLKLAAAHLDHAIRTNSARDREFCRDLCRGLKIKFYSRRVDIGKLAKNKKANVEETGRKARYEYFNTFCAKYDYKSEAICSLIRYFNQILAQLNGYKGIILKMGNLLFFREIPRKIAEHN